MSLPMLKPEELQMPGDGSVTSSMAGGRHAHGHSGAHAELDNTLVASAVGTSRGQENSIA